MKILPVKILPSDHRLDRFAGILIERTTNRIVGGHHRAAAMEATIGGVPENCITWIEDDSSETVEERPTEEYPDNGPTDPWQTSGSNS